MLRPPAIASGSGQAFHGAGRAGLRLEANEFMAHGSKLKAKGSKLKERLHVRQDYQDVLLLFYLS